MTPTSKPAVTPEMLKVKRFIDEFQYATGRNGAFAAGNLPDVLEPYPTVTMPKEMLVRFRNNYRLLAEWAAVMCGVDVEKLCPFDLLAPFLREAMQEVKDAERDA